MGYEPPFVAEKRANEVSLQERIRHARQLREDAAARVETRFNDFQISEGIWRSGNNTELEMERLSVL